MQQIKIKKPAQSTLKTSEAIQSRGEGVGPAISPRTREVYSVFRSEKKTGRLPVHGAEEEVRKSKTSLSSTARTNKSTKSDAPPEPEKVQSEAEPAPEETPPPAPGNPEISEAASTEKINDVLIKEGGEVIEAGMESTA
jgi:hypothetical protein